MIKSFQKAVTLLTTISVLTLGFAVSISAKPNPSSDKVSTTINQSSKQKNTKKYSVQEIKKLNDAVNPAKNHTKKFELKKGKHSNTQGDLDISMQEGTIDIIKDYYSAGKSNSKGNLKIRHCLNQIDQ